jgi:hypothetical protein
MNRIFAAAATFAALTTPYALGQTACKGSALTGTVRDTTQALIPGATLTLDGGAHVVSGADGRFRFACVADGAHKLAAAEPGFAAREMPLKTPRTAALDVTMQPGEVQTQVEVDADQTPADTASASGPSQTISGSRLQALADDPDDLQRELQQLAAASGGNPANTTISVDGFQGDSALPPKSSIAYIKVNPDQFSAEYREPPFEGGRVEVYTKPGQKAFHGALFTTNGSSWENAKDPFSTSKAAIGKQRYGFELTGPVRRTGSDFALTLEHRQIDNFAVIDAFEPNPAGVVTQISQNVATPQQLWLGTARLDWQLGAKNTFIASYSANVNHLANVGVGGSTLAEAGYDSGRYEHMFRLSDITTASAHLMHEARVSLRWDGETDVPQSTAPQVQVSGAFTGGGASIGQQRLKELNVEADDDAIWTGKAHTLKFGAQTMIYDEHDRLTTNFNGAYTFANLQQFQAGTPFAWTGVAGTPEVDFVQLQQAFFVQDDWKVGHGVQISGGLRYFWELNPTLLSSLTPRLGILYSPDKKGSWTVHAHGGLFAGRFGQKTNAEMLREDGIHRVTSTVYNPVYGNPLQGATTIQSMREYSPHIANLIWGGVNVGGTRTLPGGWNLSADWYYGRLWNDVRSVNVNAPRNGAPTGPRPGAPNLNILQMNNSGQGDLSAAFVGVENHNYKRAQFFLGAVRVELIDDTDDNELSTPQSSYSDVGEFAHRTGQNTWNYFGNATFTLPEKVQLSANLNGGAGAHYNITTGYDNNGDGDFNDRPQYAAPGQAGAIQTPYGLLIASGGTGVFPRNKGVMPATIYLDMNLQRAFKLTRNAKAEHQQTLTLNVRSSNVLNHLNVTSVGGVLGSPEFGAPYAADPGRRVEAGARYSF